MNLDELASLAREMVEDGDENTDSLDWFLVGGAVRDALRGLQPEDLDFVVVGETSESMKSRGFRLVNSNNNDTFPVFLNSKRNEFALARSERNTGNSHTDFEVETENVSLEEDLLRRDFTVNAMALSPDGELIDPHGGREDLAEGIIHPTNPDAFKDDPLRALRAARFAARLDAELSVQTRAMMKSGEVAACIASDLPGERIRMEMEKAFVQAEEPSRFFRFLQETGLLTAAFPELAELATVPAGPEEHHEEGTAFEHTMMVLDEVSKDHPKDEILHLMALSHDLGKSETSSDLLPAHHGHGKAALPLIENMDERLSFSNEQLAAMKDAAVHHMRLKEIADMRSATVFDLFEQTRVPQKLVHLGIADANGKIPQGEFDWSLAEHRLGCAEQATKEVSGATLISEGISPDEIGGEAFGKRLRDRRIQRMKELE